MFSIPYWRSIGIGLHVLLAIVRGITEFPVSVNSIHTSEVCVNVSDEISCYFKGSEHIVAWNEARRICNSFGSKLPVIRNINDQNAVAGYLKSHNINNSEAWTAGRSITSNEWTWINGDSLAELQENYVQNGEGDYAAVDTGLKFTALAANNELPYICEYGGSYCDSSSDIFMTDKCLRYFNDKRKWYDARNECLMNNGDLAVIGEEERGHLDEELKLNESYWIGLRKKSWRWTLNDNVEPMDEVTYTNWQNFFSTDGECIFIDASDGKWKTSGCTEKRGVVCKRSQGVTFPATTETSVEAMTKVDSFTYVLKESTTGESQSSGSQSLLFAAVGAGIVIIICIIVIIFFVMRTKKGENRQSIPTDSSPQYEREEFDSRITNTPVYTSVNEPANAPVTTSDDMRGVYAEIPMSTANQSEDGATDQQPGTVYASLEFNEEPTCLEPNKTHANTTAPNKVCLLGDIYAMPDAKAGTSPGNESASQPVKVNPQGEVVYANLQAEMLGKEQASEEHDHTK